MGNDNSVMVHANSFVNLLFKIHHAHSEENQINMESITYCVFVSIGTKSDFSSRCRKVHKVTDGEW